MNAFVIRDTAANFTAANPTLLLNQWGVETDVRNNVNIDTGKAKIGDGITEWNDLDYWNPDGSPGLKGGIDCSANPSYPAAVAGDNYIVTVGGKIGGGFGLTVSIGDVLFCLTDNAGGSQASVGADWDVLDVGIAGDVVGPASATDGVPALFDGTTGKLLKNSVPTGSGVPVLATGPTLSVPVLGTPASGTLTNCTGLPVAGLSNLGTGVGTFLITPSSANLKTAVTDETGTGGALVFATSPALTTPDIGVATATSVNKVAITAPATSATLTIADGKTATVSNSITFAGTDATTMTFPGASASVGYLNVPVNSQSVDYTAVLADSGKMLLQTGTSKTFTIPANATVAYPVGTALTFGVSAASGCSIAITTDTMTLANSTTTGTRTLAQNGIATAIKWTSTTWVISGVGLT